VAITVKGRMSPGLAAAVLLADTGAYFDVEVVPRHDAVVIAPGDVARMVAVLEALERRGIELDRIVERGTVPLHG